MATNVRYVSSSNGINVRKTAAGTKAVSLNYGDLMYDIPGVAPVTKPLDGTSYVWVKVHYYRSSTNPAEEGDGWVATANAPVVSTTVPSKSDTFSSNSHLKQHERLANARYIYKYLSDNGWKSNAIYAALGNMEKESTINPGKWQDYNNTELGYGLTQWSPATKLTKWLNGKEKSDIDNQLSRIIYEVAHDTEQWTKGNHSPAMTFAEFTTSTKDCSELAEYFVRCYENNNASATSIAERQTNAQKWSTLIGYLV